MNTAGSGVGLAVLWVTRMEMKNGRSRLRGANRLLGNLIGRHRKGIRHGRRVDAHP